MIRLMQKQRNKKFYQRDAPKTVDLTLVGQQMCDVSLFHVFQSEEDNGLQDYQRPTFACIFHEQHSQGSKTSLEIFPRRCKMTPVLISVAIDT